MRAYWVVPLFLFAVSVAQAQTLGERDIAPGANAPDMRSGQVAVAMVASALMRDPAAATVAASAASSLLAHSTASLPIHASGNFRLDVPFRTQKDGARFQGSNCGPASLAMVLQSYGVAQENADLRWLVQAYQGNQGRGGGTNLEDLASVGKDFGLKPLGLYSSGEDFARWTPADVEEQLRQGHPVIALVKYRLLPDHLTANIGYDHYVAIFGVQGDQFLYHDPAYQAADDGAFHWISAEQLATAMGTASIPRQAVAFASGSRPVLAFKPL